MKLFAGIVIVIIGSLILTFALSFKTGDSSIEILKTKLLDIQVPEGYYAGYAFSLGRIKIVDFDSKNNGHFAMISYEEGGIIEYFANRQVKKLLRKMDEEESEKLENALYGDSPSYIYESYDINSKGQRYKSYTGVIKGKEGRLFISANAVIGSPDETAMEEFMKSL